MSSIVLWSIFVSFISSINGSGIPIGISMSLGFIIVIFLSLIAIDDKTIGGLGRSSGIKHNGEITNIRAPCVFRSDEEEMHKYSAILAATEPFRNLCHAQIKNAMNPLVYFFYWIQGTA
jgi:hypothetical protein